MRAAKATLTAAILAAAGSGLLAGRGPDQVDDRSALPSLAAAGSTRGETDPGLVAACGDEDGDGVCDGADMCPLDFDPAQPDADGDGIGDPCDAFGAPRTVAPFFDDPHRIASADLDSDGDADVVVAGGVLTTPQSGRVEWHENLAGDGAAWGTRVIATGQSVVGDLTTGDVDGDGDADVIVGFGGGLLWYENPGPAGPSWPRRTIEPSDNVFRIRGSDVDGDGDLDLISPVILHGTPLTVLAWQENLNGDGSAWARRPLVTWYSVDAVSACDVDGDGDGDIIAGGSPARSSAEIRISWFENVGGGGSAWIEHVVASRDFVRLDSISPGDVDGDGDMDLFASGDLDATPLTPGRAAWHESPGSPGGPWTEHVIHDEFQGYPSILAVDLDGDGDQDAVTRIRASAFDPKAWHENVASDGTEWRLRRIHPENRRPFDLAAADLDADGDPDLLASISGYDQIEWHENTGLPNLSPRAIAGPDVTAECQGPFGAVVALDASASSDPEGQPLTYVWSGPFAPITTTDPVAAVELPRGTHVVRLEVSDPWGGISRDTVTITVDLLETTPRTVTLNPAVLWPPDHRLVEVEAQGPALCAGVLRGIWSSEPDEGTGDGDRPGDIQFTGGSSEPGGGDDFRFLLRAERAGHGPGRVYTARYELPDIDGSPLQVVAEVVVPKDHRRFRQMLGAPPALRDRRRLPVEP